MEGVSTVILKLSDYNELIKIKDSIINDDCLVCDGYSGRVYSTKKEKIIHDMKEEIEKLLIQNNELKERLGKPDSTYKYDHQDKIKDWSILNFCRTRGYYRKDFKERLKDAALNMAK